ncbi:hypothetical protein KQI86_19275 [Clostridium sp. MSJ-11]|uniref:Uncharacterized protein n=1 Tax=Clostridium mobile TaxID=2841512 RepID=A0ABS6EP68_9CLOT|nr:hypothetical protein [Clostridium mobile]MBU5486446.1 hypothetical protein [Clostridium mobile]
MKTRANFSVEADIKSDFDILAKKLSLNKSQWFENHMKSLIDQHKELLQNIKNENE